MTIEDIESKYPELFTDCFDFSVGEGWLPIVDTLCELISAQNTGLEQKAGIIQIKEKFRTLTVYLSNGTGEMDRWIEFASRMSSKVCEECGRKGKLVGSSWIKTLCPEHSKNFK